MTVTRPENGIKYSYYGRASKEMIVLCHELANQLLDKFRTHAQAAAVAWYQAPGIYPKL